MNTATTFNFTSPSLSRDYYQQILLASKPTSHSSQSTDADRLKQGDLLPLIAALHTTESVTDPFIILGARVPKDSHFADLCQTWVKVIHPDPLARGAPSGRPGDYGSECEGRKTSGDPDQAHACRYCGYRKKLSHSARSRGLTNLKTGFGDALIIRTKEF